MGLSEVSDALAILVSEEREGVTAFHHGNMQAMEASNGLRAIVNESLPKDNLKRIVRQGPNADTCQINLIFYRLYHRQPARKADCQCNLFFFCTGLFAYLPESTISYSINAAITVQPMAWNIKVPTGSRMPDMVFRTALTRKTVPRSIIMLRICVKKRITGSLISL